MERLAAYLAAFARLLGNKDRVHFDRLDPGSTASVARVEREAVPKVFARIDGARRAEAANDVSDALEEINDLARADNALARVDRRPANGERTTVLHFSGRDTPVQSKFGPFTEATELVGELVRIGGKDESAHATLIDAEGRSWSGEIKKDLAQAMAHYLYKTVRVAGDVRWMRDEDGAWKMLALRFSTFEQLSNEGLLSAVKNLRALRDSDWSKSKDIDAEIRDSRGHGDELH